MLYGRFNFFILYYCHFMCCVLFFCCYSFCRGGDFAGLALSLCRLSSRAAAAAAFIITSSSLYNMSESSQGSKPLSAYQLFLAALCPLSVILLSFKYKLGIEKMVIIASSRAAFQLFFAGYVLLGFIFSINSPILVFGYILVMAFIAAVEVTARQLRTYSGEQSLNLIF